MHNRQFWAGLAAITMIAVLQAAAQLDHALFLDEPFTANLVRLSLPEMAGEFRYDTTMPLHYFILKAWLTIAGTDSEIALRLPSLVAFCFSILLAGFTGQKLGGAKSGLLAAFILASSTGMGLSHAVSARPYALLGLIVAAATLVYVYRVGLIPAPVPARRLDMLLVALNTLGLLTHPIYGFFIVSYTLTALLVARRLVARLAILGGLSALFTLLIWGPVLWYTARLPSTDWMQPPKLPDLAGGFLLWKPPIISALLLVFFSIVVFHRADAIARRLGDRRYILLTSLIVLINVGLYVLSQFKPMYNAGRSPTLYLFPVALLAGLFVRQYASRLLTLLIVLALGAGIIRTYEIALVNEGPSSARDSIRAILSEAECGDSLILAGLTFSEVSYYLRRLDAPDCFYLVVFPQEVEEHPGWIDIDGLLDDPAALAHEAAMTVTGLSARHDTRVWFFHGWDLGDEVINTLTPELDHHLTRQGTLPLGGSFFSVVSVYHVQ